MSLTDVVIMPGVDYQDACNAIREKDGSAAFIKSGEMGAKIRAISTGENLDAELETQDELIEDIVTALAGKAAGSGDGIVPSGTKQITENGTYDVTEYATAEVNVPTDSSAPVLQSKRVTPTTSRQTVTPDSGYDGLSSVVVNAMPAATQATPSITVDSNGKITAKATQSAGYVAAGTKSATKQLTTKGATTITPTSSVQTAVSAGTYVTGDIKVAAVSGGSSGESNTSMISFTVTGNSFGEKVVYIDSEGNLVTATTDGTYQTMAGFASVSANGRHLSAIDKREVEMWFGEYEDVAILKLIDGAVITYT